MLSKYLLAILYPKIKNDFLRVDYLELVLSNLDKLQPQMQPTPGNYFMQKEFIDAQVASL